MADPDGLLMPRPMHAFALPRPYSDQLLRGSSSCNAIQPAAPMLTTDPGCNHIQQPEGVQGMSALAAVDVCKHRPGTVAGRVAWDLVARNNAGGTGASMHLAGQNCRPYIPEKRLRFVARRALSSGGLLH
jgi:hypothetical protein